MTQSEISTRRLINQCIVQKPHLDPQMLVRHMGAVQAQDFTMARWALGVRLPEASDARVQMEIDRGSIIRTHVMRPTWHLVAATDVRWMLALTAPFIRSQMGGRQRDLGLTAAVIDKSTRLLTDALAGGRSCTRREIAGLFEQAGISNSDNRFAHLFMIAELDGLICSGPSKGKETTYALMAERVPACPLPGREESLQKLALAYFTSHGPATLADFTWWSGLPVSLARQALELNKKQLSGFTCEGRDYWMTETDSGPVEEASGVWLIPAFDELIISYKDRDAILDSNQSARAVSSNGIFRPVILVDGKVAGLWKKSVKGAGMVIETEFFEKKRGAGKQKLQGAIAQYVNFMDGQASKSLNSRI